MNKVMLLGRLAMDVEVRYSQAATPIAVARYSLAVSRPFAKQGQPNVDFINIVAFGKAAEFAEKYFQKGQKVVVVGRLQQNQWKDAEGKNHYNIDVIVEEQHFAESKKEDTYQASTESQQQIPDEEDDLPF